MRYRPSVLVVTDCRTCLWFYCHENYPLGTPAQWFLGCYAVEAHEITSGSPVGAVAGQAAHKLSPYISCINPKFLGRICLQAESCQPTHHWQTCSLSLAGSRKSDGCERHCQCQRQWTQQVGAQQLRVCQRDVPIRASGGNVG